MLRWVAGTAFLHEAGSTHSHGSFARQQWHVIIKDGGTSRMTTSDRSPGMTRLPCDPRPRPSRTCTHTDLGCMHRRIVELAVDPERSMGSWISPAARQRNKANPAKMAVEAPVVLASPRRNKANLYESFTIAIPAPLMPAARTRETAKRTHEYPRGRGCAGFTDLADDSASGNPAGRSDDARRHDGSDCRVGRASMIHVAFSGREGWCNPKHLAGVVRHFRRGGHGGPPHWEGVRSPHQWGGCPCPPAIADNPGQMPSSYPRTRP
jgi:hypothetical protein